MLAPNVPTWMTEFRAFVMRGSVVDLAVGIIIGSAFTGVVSSLVKDVFNPFLGLFTGGVDFSNLFFSLSGHHYDTLADAQKAGAATLNVGLFINAIIQFVIVSFAVFWIVKALTKIKALIAWIVDIGYEGGFLQESKRCGPYDVRDLAC